MAVTPTVHISYRWARDDVGLVTLEIYTLHCMCLTTLKRALQRSGARVCGGRVLIGIRQSSGPFSLKWTTHGTQCALFNVVRTGGILLRLSSSEFSWKC